jgi:trehalose-phosphatase
LDAATRAQIGQFLKAASAAPTRLLMLDYDGTLAPFQIERDQAYPYPRVVEILHEIAGGARTRVVIVSGRDVGELFNRIGMQPVPEMWGLHGRQRRRPDGSIETTPVNQRYLDALSDAHRWLEYQRLQSVVERKTGSIAAHWRGLSDLEAAEIRARVLLGWKPIADRNGLHVLDFDGGIEILAPGATKGNVVRILLAEEGPRVAAAYMGDDSSDEFAFRAIDARGLSVLVRPERRPTAAQLWLRPPDEVISFLEQWLETCRKSSAERTGRAVGANGR